MGTNEKAPRRNSKNREALQLAGQIRALQKCLPKKPLPNELKGHPFDRLLLQNSPLYRKSRELFLQLGGTHTATLLSSPRSLGSLSLVHMEIQYSPLEEELLWTANDAYELKHRPERLLDLRTWVTSLFHEQNHRILWNVLPPVPTRNEEALRQYFHFAESLVVMLDMALADRLEAQIAQSLYQVGAIYDPGTELERQLKKTDRKRSGLFHKNALHAAQEATFLNLELCEPQEIQFFLGSLFPADAFPKIPKTPPGLERAIARALRLDRQFVEQTNPEWLVRHAKKAALQLSQLQKQQMKNAKEPEINDFFDRSGWVERVLQLYEFS
jgi:hypothetical protein